MMIDGPTGVGQHRSREFAGNGADVATRPNIRFKKVEESAECGIVVVRTPVGNDDLSVPEIESDSSDDERDVRLCRLALQFLPQERQRIVRALHCRALGRRPGGVDDAFEHVRFESPDR